MKIIKLTQNKESFIDDEDFEDINKYKWYLSKGRNTNYAEARVNGKKIRMHKFIMNNLDKIGIIDHIDRNGLNNQKENLRIVSFRQNLMNSKIYKNNTSGTRGVYFHNASKKWEANIRHKGKTIHLGTFIDINLAKIVYEKKVKELCASDLV